jgi:tetratricopeptide (TPR) repeat protein
VQSSLGIVLYFSRRYDDAVTQLKRTLELEPRNTAAVLALGVTYEEMGKPQEALAVFDHTEFGDSPYAARAYAKLGRRDDAIRVLNGFIKRGGVFDPQSVALAYFALDDKERGFQWLTRAIDERAGYVPWANVQPGFDGIRDDPRFKALIARLKLPG